MFILLYPPFHKLFCGSDPLSGWLHSADLIYVSDILDIFTVFTFKVKYVLSVCTNTDNTGPHFSGNCSVWFVLPIHTVISILATGWLLPFVDGDKIFTTMPVQPTFRVPASETEPTWTLNHYECLKYFFLRFCFHIDWTQALVSI
jgi:hypothetical protein